MERLYGTASVRLDVGFADNLLPFLGFVEHEFSKVGGCHQYWIGAKSGPVDVIARMSVLRGEADLA
jgi:hypothetical protein